MSIIDNIRKFFPEDIFLFGDGCTADILLVASLSEKMFDSFWFIKPEESPMLTSLFEVTC